MSFLDRFVPMPDPGEAPAAFLRRRARRVNLAVATPLLLADLYDRVDALERRVAALEAERDAR
jgi:hypothetical protein